MQRRAIVLFRGDPRREARQKGLPSRLLPTLHAELERIISGVPDADLITASETGSRFELRSAEWSFVSSADEALSEKIDHALRVTFDAGYESVVLLAGDIAGLRGEDLTRALDSLDLDRVVLGPSRDGGFYLAGFRGYLQIDWSALPMYSGSALAGLAAQLEALQVHWAFAPRLDDIDSRSDAHAVAMRLRHTRFGALLSSLLDAAPVPREQPAFALAAHLHGSISRAPPSF